MDEREGVPVQALPAHGHRREEWRESGQKKPGEDEHRDRQRFVLILFFVVVTLM